MVTLNLKLDVIPNGRAREIWLNQYDDDFTLQVQLFSSAGILTIPSGSTAAIRGTKPDGNGYSASCVLDVANKVVTVTGDQQMTAVYGKTIFEVTIYNNGKELNSANFIMHVERAALDSDTIQSESILRELQAIIDGAATATQAAEDAADAADRAEGALGGAIGELKDEFISIINSNIDGFVIPLNSGWIPSNGSIVDYTDVRTPTIGQKYAVVECTEGDVFTISGIGMGTARLWCFIDADNNSLSVAPQNHSTDGMVLTAPEGASRLIVNIKMIGALFSGIPLKNRINELENDIIADTRNLIKSIKSRFIAKDKNVSMNIIDTGVEVNGTNAAYSNVYYDIILEPGTYSLATEIDATNGIGGVSYRCGANKELCANAAITTIVPLTSYTTRKYKNYFFDVCADKEYYRFYFWTNWSASIVTTNVFYRSLSLSKNNKRIEFPFIPYRSGVDYVIREKFSEYSIFEACINALGIFKLRKYCEAPYIISNSLTWGGLAYYKHICYPIQAGVSVRVTANNTVTSVVAFLTSDEYAFGESPSWCHEEEEDSGNPVLLNVRYIVNPGKTIIISTPNDCKFLYLASIGQDGLDLLPFEVIVNGVDIIKNPQNIVVEQSDSKSSTILFVDFNDDKDLEIFKGINNEHINGYTGMGSYDSIFKTDSTTAYIDSGSLVLRCYQPDSPVPDPELNPTRYFRYKSPYIATTERFAIRKGKITARIKCSATPRDGFVWTFFTFGQNDTWGPAPEFDIVECYANVTRDSSDGHFIDGTYLSLLGCYTHYRKNDGTMGTLSRTYYSDDVTVVNHEISSWDFHWARNNWSIDEWFKNWHTYSVKWDENEIQYFIDDEMVKTIDTTELTSTIWTSPQDIRVNFKARQWAESKSEALFIDWIKVETYENTNPCLSISYDDITLHQGDSVMIKPTFYPEPVSNVAFTLDSSDETIVKCDSLSNGYERVEHKITAVGESGSEAKITMSMSNGSVKSSFVVTIE